MAYAVSLLFNRGLSDSVSRQWTRLADAGISRSMPNLGYPPHVTLAVYDAMEADAATTALDGVFEDAAQMVVTLTQVTTFERGGGVLYAALAPSPDLMRLHALAVTAIGEVCRPHYQTGAWTPHCTLATELNDIDLQRAKGVLERQWRPLTGTFEVAALVQFPPVVGLKDWTLAPLHRSNRTS
jgi:2'-5' RNA ligase